MNRQVFREYDIRGIVEKDFTDDFNVDLGRAYATILHRAGKRKITLGRDCRLSSPRLRNLIRLCWQIGTIGWICGGVLLIAASSMASAPARHWIVVTMVAMYGFGVIGNAWIFRGRHFGWMALSAVIALAMAGY